MRVLFLITARGGSKSVPRKNLLQLDGISLVGFKAISAKKSRYCCRLIISTDSQEIQEDALRYGVEVPFTRPAELASDTAATEDVVMHALRTIEAEGGEPYDAVMLLEPSSPFATHEHYDNAIRLMEEKGANLVVGMKPVTVNSVFQGPLDEQGRITSIINKMQALDALRRQDVAQEFTMNGALYLMNWAFFRATGKRYVDPELSYGLVMDAEHSIEIDEPIDYEFARFLVESGRIDLSEWRG